MEILELCKRIGMPEPAVEQIMRLDIPEEVYLYMNRLRRTDYDGFCREVRNSKDFRVRFLYYFCRFACETYEDYINEQISESIFFDTFRDLKHWCENCRQEFGEYGIDEAEWFWRLFDRTLFKLGRLQFETMNVKRDIGCNAFAIKKGEPVINVHIPQGEPLDWAACEASFAAAYEWFGREIPYICHSWLLFPGLKEILPEESNIIQFQNHFRLLEMDYLQTEALWRIFSKVREDMSQYPEQTSLQRGAKAYLYNGKRLGRGLGRYLPDDLKYV